MINRVQRQWKDPIWVTIVTSFGSFGPEGACLSGLNTLVDTHWIGGSPRKLEVYGWAAWSPAKGILTLRNPSDHDQEFVVDLAAALELPAGAAQTYSIASPYPQRELTGLLGFRKATAPVTIKLNPSWCWCSRRNPRQGKSYGSVCQAFEHAKIQGGEGSILGSAHDRQGDDE